jgi:hypothetical protein
MLKKFKTTLFAILTLSLMGSSLALASTPKTEAARSFSLQGKVVAVDLKERTMSIQEEGTGREYIVVVPESSAFKITFGKDSKRSIPTLDNVSVGDRVRCNVRLSSDEEQVAKRSTKVTVTKS